ncbi:MAG: hypothetical protein KJ868_16265 [Gammaproteobacteria bacterium]|nr:hypothetical protein [Gammaproteobacteria bacterium]MBU2239563.1 hypothetical protein [Gammaproteobacteria bacterium]MBU2411328.1 hypothetical protein [Gammaproteobacteria bacterium]
MKKTLLLGAGFSYDLGMPLASELTEIFLSMFSDEKSNQRFIDVLAANDPYSQGHPINRAAISQAVKIVTQYNGVNYEALLAEIESLSSQYGSSVTQSDRDSYHYISGIFYSIIHLVLNSYQLLSYQLIYQKNSPYFKEIKSILSEHETWVFTLNHDMYFECLALDYNIPISYGDPYKMSLPVDNRDLNNLINFTYSKRDELLDNNFFSNQFGVNLVKLHGGLSELLYKENTQLCNQSLSLENSNHLIQNFIKIQNMGYYSDGQKVPSGKDRVITDVDGELDIICQSMLTGGNKYSRTTKDKKGEEKLMLMVKQLDKTDELTIIGYGFGDKHINSRISNAMVRNPNMKIKIVDAISKPVPEILEQFDYDLRIIRNTCGAAHWMSYLALERWDRELMETLDNNKQFRQQIKEVIKRQFSAKKV